MVTCSGASDNTTETLPAESNFLNHVDLENNRVKDVTDAIMYDLLPAAIAAVTQEVDEVPQELTWNLSKVSLPLNGVCLLCSAVLTFIACMQQVAGTVLSVACLLNAPPSFLEFLLCIPWRHLGGLYPR